MWIFPSLPIDRKMPPPDSEYSLIRPFCELFLVEKSCYIESFWECNSWMHSTNECTCSCLCETKTSGRGEKRKTPNRKEGERRDEKKFHRIEVTSPSALIRRLRVQCLLSKKMSLSLRHCITSLWNVCCSPSWHLAALETPYSKREKDERLTTIEWWSGKRSKNKNRASRLQHEGKIMPLPSPQINSFFLPFPVYHVLLFFFYLSDSLWTIGKSITG